MKTCPFCNHSRAAHVDRVHCALCHCQSRRSEDIQQSFGFRDAITAHSDRRQGRKR